MAKISADEYFLCVGYLSDLCQRAQGSRQYNSALSYRHVINTVSVTTTSLLRRI